MPNYEEANFYARVYRWILQPLECLGLTNQEIQQHCPLGKSLAHTHAHTRDRNILLFLNYNNYIWDINYFIKKTFIERGIPLGIPSERNSTGTCTYAHAKEFGRNSVVVDPTDPQSRAAALFKFNLDVCQEDVEQAIKNLKQRWNQVLNTAKPNTAEAYERNSLLARVKHLSNLYDQAYRQATGKKLFTYRTFHSPEKYKHFAHFLAFHATFKLLGIHKDEDIRRYFLGVSEEFYRPQCIQSFVPIRTMASTKMLFYFMQHLKTEFEGIYKTLTPAPDKYRHDYYQHLFNDAISLCNMNIYNANGHSRLSADIPSALGSDPMYAVYCYSVPWLRKLWESGVLETAGWSSVHKAITALSQEVKDDGRLHRTVELVGAKALQLWEDANIPERNDNDLKTILPYFVEYPEAQQQLLTLYGN